MSRGRVVTQVATCKHCGEQIMRYFSSWESRNKGEWAHAGRRSRCRVTTYAEPLEPLEP